MFDILISRVQQDQPSWLSSQYEAMSGSLLLPPHTPEGGTEDLGMPRIYEHPCIGQTFTSTLLLVVLKQTRGLRLHGNFRSPPIGRAVAPASVVLRWAFTSVLATASNARYKPHSFQGVVCGSSRRRRLDSELLRVLMSTVLPVLFIHN